MQWTAGAGKHGDGARCVRGGTVADESYAAAAGAYSPLGSQVDDTKNYKTCPCSVFLFDNNHGIYGRLCPRHSRGVLHLAYLIGEILAIRSGAWQLFASQTGMRHTGAVRAWPVAPLTRARNLEGPFFIDMDGIPMGG